MAKLSRKQIANALADSWVSKGTNRKDLAAQTAALMIEEGRKNEVDLVVKDVKYILFSKYGIVVTEVFTKNPLTDTNKANITTLVKQKLSSAKKIVINENIDDSLLGGAFIATPEFSLDLTINSKLKKLRNV